MDEQLPQPPPAPWPTPSIEPVTPPRRTGRRRLVAAVIVTLLVVGAVTAGVVATRPRPPAAPRVVLVDPAGGLAIVDGVGGGRIAHAPAGTTFAFPAWSPDGAHVAAVATTGDATAIEVFGTAPDAAVDGTTLYTSADSAPFYLYWSPDGRAITFLTAAGTDIALRSAPADGSAAATVVREGAPMYWAWEDPGRMLVHTGGDQAAFLGAVRPDGSTIAPIEGSMGDFRAPAASSDARYEAYLVTKPDGSAAVVTSTADGGSRHEVGVFGSAAFGFGRSGSQLAFVAADAADAVYPFPIGPLRLIDAATGDVRSLPATSVVAFFWSPDTRRIATIGLLAPTTPPAARRSGDNRDPAKAAPRGRLASVRAGSGVGAAAPGADGVPVGVQFIDVAAGTATLLQTVSLSPLYVNQVLPYFDQYALSHHVWSPDGASILLPVIADDGSEELQVIPADGSAPRVLAPGSMGFWSP
jgi:TolB protein